MKKNFLILILTILSMMVVGCSKEAVESTENNTKSGSNENIIDMVNDKYYIEMPQKNEKNGNIIVGTIFYFNGESLVVEHIPYEENFITFKHTDTKVENNSIIYTVDRTYDGETIDLLFKITKDKNDKLKFTWASTEPKDLKLINKDEFIKVIKENYSDFIINTFAQSFSKKFNLDVEELSSNSKDDNSNEELTETSKDSNNLNNENEINQRGYRSKERAIARAKEIVNPKGVKFLKADDITSTTFYDGRECWQFYIGSGDSRVELIYIDVETGQFRESFNPSSDWRNEW